MKITLKLAAISALMAVGIAQSNAADKTIWVQHLNIALSAWHEGSDKPTKIDTKAVIKALSEAVSGGVTNPVFTTGAQLLLKEDTTSSSGNTAIVVRQGHPTVDTDVSDFFTFDTTASV